jgi:hypothetical protein
MALFDGRQNQEVNLLRSAQHDLANSPPRMRQHF